MTRRGLTADERFDMKVDRSGGPDACWPWTAAVSGNGYGYFHPTRDTAIGAHRYAYTREHGPVPDGMVVDHDCHNRSGCTLTKHTGCPHTLCCNPAHLGLRTSDDNVKAATNARHKRTHCPRNHVYTAENTRLQPSPVPGNAPMRKCRACKRESYVRKTPPDSGLGRPRKERTRA